MCRRSDVALRDGSECAFDDRGLESGLLAAWTSRPAVNALSPAPEMMTARVLGSWEKKSIRALSSYHIGS